MKCEPMINVADVQASSKWYQQLLGATSGHGGPDFEMLTHGGALTLMLHNAAAAEHHPHMERDGVNGKGVVLYFRVGEDLGAAVGRATQLGATVQRALFFNALAHQEELWLTDPDGYTVVLCGPAAWAP